jgi:DNA-directed RNA polymerase
MDRMINAEDNYLDAGLRLSEARYERNVNKAINEEGLEATPMATAIVTKWFKDLVIIIEDRLAKDDKELEADLHALWLSIGSERLALCGFAGLLQAISHGKSVTKALILIGKRIEAEAWAEGLLKFSKEARETIEKRVRMAHSKVSIRMKAAKVLAKRAGYIAPNWNDAMRLKAGGVIFDCCLSLSDVFTLDGDDQPTITDFALAHAESAIVGLIERDTVRLPLFEKPVPWTAMREGGYPANTAARYFNPLVRRHDKVVQRRVNEALADGSMQPVLDALNALQSVMYAIDQDQLEVVKWAFQTGQDVDGIPPLKDVDLPARPRNWDELTEAQQKLWKRQRGEVRTLNRSYKGQRLVLQQDLEVAEWIGEKPFATPMNLDFRGRVYPLPYFNFQRSDVVRSLFRFSKGQTMTEEGLYWLKVHIANCGDFDKISKASYDERVKWVDDNTPWLLEAARKPKERLDLWGDADQPFSFLAAVREFMAFLDANASGQAFTTHLPIAFDASASGLQILCAMTLADEGALVNLVPQGKPVDLYMTICSKVKELLDQWVNQPEREQVAPLADIIRQLGVERSMVKRPTMCFSYGSKRYGMREQILTDTMKPLKDKVTAGELPVHPYGNDNGFMASNVLAEAIYTSIKEVMKAPYEAMNFLQACAKALAHENKHVEWVTPLGMPVVHRVLEEKDERISLWLHNSGVKQRFRPRVTVDTETINKRTAANGISPQFVHSYDACLLQMVAIECQTQNIEIAVIHDSFSCLAPQASEMGRIIRECFVQLFTQHDALSCFRDTVLRQLTHANWHRIPHLPVKGGLTLETVKDAQYAFS